MSLLSNWELMFRNSDLPAEFPNQWGGYFSLPPLAYFLLLFLFVIRNQYKFPIQLLASLFDSLFLLGIFFFLSEESFVSCSWSLYSSTNSTEGNYIFWFIQIQSGRVNEFLRAGDQSCSIYINFMLPHLSFLTTLKHLRKAYLWYILLLK